MTERIAPLTPFPLPLLLGRIAREWDSRQCIFDLPLKRFHLQAEDIDLSVEVAGRRVATPAGPAAGPHTQLAQNIVLGWLTGARSFELKTVQILDELEIERPCIDMETIGFNVEWSQELSLAQSLTEYLKASVLLEILKRWEPLRSHLGEPGEHVFELSVGYDLDGITSDRMRGFISGLRNAGPVIDEMRSLIHGPFAHLRDVPIPNCLIGSATISTFHGCPPDQIEAIVEHLMTEHGLDVTVKLNPTLLGHERVRHILHERLGYLELGLVPEAFAEDLSLDQAFGMIERLDRFARDHGRVFGIKLTNTLVVTNHKGQLPGQRMYLSGPPLHVLAVTLLDELVAKLPRVLQLGSLAGTVPVAFSAGVDKENFVDVVGMGLVPVTVCTDLLKPGGYGRLTAMLRRLATAVRDAGCRDLASWQQLRDREAKRAGHRDQVAAAAADLATASGSRRYSSSTHEKLPRRIERELQMWDCSSCHLCVTVCPNDAFMQIATPSAMKSEFEQRWQYLCLAELCNSCGNCETFCPERGDPAAVKPRLFVDPARFAREEEPAFLALRANESVTAAGGGPFVANPSWQVADQTQRLVGVLNGPPGLPLRPEDLSCQPD